MICRLLLLAIGVATILAGCDNSIPSPQDVDTRVEQSVTNGDEIADLGDRIANLSLNDATELSAYLSHVHGIVRAGQTRPDDEDTRQKGTFDAKIVSLGDQIASLSLRKSTSLSTYLASKHGIEADN